MQVQKLKSNSLVWESWMNIGQHSKNSKERGGDKNISQ